MWLPTLLFSAFVSAAPLAAGEPGLVTGEEQFLYRPVPDLTMECVPGGSLPLSRLWNEKPLLLTLVFTRCSGVCSPYVRFLKSAVDSAGGAGREYRVVVVSFDPQDQVADLARLAGRLELSRDPAWSFCVSSPGEIRRLSDAIGFWWYRWDETRREFDHSSRLVAIDRGRVARILEGHPVEPRRLREVVEELRRNFVPTYPLSRPLLFRCFGYDPRRDALTFDWGSLVLLLPGALSILCTSWIFFRRGRRGRA